LNHSGAAIINSNIGSVCMMTCEHGDLCVIGSSHHESLYKRSHFQRCLYVVCKTASCHHVWLSGCTRLVDLCWCID